jgi:hypothetical protein
LLDSQNNIENFLLQHSYYLYLLITHLQGSTAISLWSCLSPDLPSPGILYQSEARSHIGGTTERFPDPFRNAAARNIKSSETLLWIGSDYLGNSGRKAQNKLSAGSHQLTTIRRVRSPDQGSSNPISRQVDLTFALTSSGYEVSKSTFVKGLPTSYSNFITQS